MSAVSADPPNIRRSMSATTSSRHDGIVLIGSLPGLAFGGKHADDALYLLADSWQDDYGTDPTFADRAIEAFRQLAGATDPLKAATGSIRADFALQVQNNLVHGSDSPDSAKREINLFFPELV